MSDFYLQEKEQTEVEMLTAQEIPAKTNTELLTEAQLEFSEAAKDRASPEILAEIRARINSLKAEIIKGQTNAQNKKV
jgi:hypothetical protein